MSQRMEELLDSYRTKIEVYERTVDRPAEDYLMWESVEMAREAVLQETHRLLFAVEHLRVCRTCAEGSLADCPTGAEIQRLLHAHADLKTKLAANKTAERNT